VPKTKAGTKVIHASKAKWQTGMPLGLHESVRTVSLSAWVLKSTEPILSRPETVGCWDSRPLDSHVRRKLDSCQ